MISLKSENYFHLPPRGGRSQCKRKPLHLPSVSAVLGAAIDLGGGVYISVINEGQ